ncbi:MAG: type II toxin-antitoxin system VapC family toxin [Acidobacteriota bacterium]
MTLIADTGGLYALFDADDRYHGAVRAVVEKERGPIVVPAAILAELDYLLREFLGVDAELTLLDNLLEGALTLDVPPFEDLRRARELIATYRDLDLGYADAAVVTTAERLGSRRILTVDLRDFRTVIPSSGEPFVLLPADR